MPMPSDPAVVCTGIVPEKCSVFKSAVQPMRMTFNCEITKEVADEETEETKNTTETEPEPEEDDGLINTKDSRPATVLTHPEVKQEPYSVMFKNGDDTRQDQLILQLIDMFDKILRKININLPFTAFKCLACSKDDGIMEFVKKSQTIQDVRAKFDDDLGKFLKFKAHETGMPLKEIESNYLLSNAGYAAATYLLALGDRHLENLMVCDDGKFFHLDFGFIFGK